MATALAGLALLFAAGAASAANTMAVQPDGKIVLGGSGPHGFGYLARLDPGGELDPGFGVGGVVVDHRLGPVSAVAVQPDGKVLAGVAGGVARYRADGSVDSGFGSDGVSVGGWYPGWTYALDVLADGRIAVVGTTHLKLLPSVGFALVLSPDGRSREWSGGTGNGTALTALLPRGDGSLLLAGYEEVGGRGLLARFVPAAGPDYDHAFGAGAGLVRFSNLGDGEGFLGVNAIAADPAGVLVAGVAASQLLLARFSDQGVLDKSFGGEGFVTLGGEGSARASALAVQPDGKILAVGDDYLNPGGASCSTCRSLLLARFLPGGTPDSGFGQGGVARLPALDGGRRPGLGDDVDLLPDGKVLVAGRADEVSGNLTLGRFDRTGAIDPGFGAGGAITVDPCAGGEALLRRRGCLASARAGPRLRRTRRRGTALHLRVRPAADWAQLRSVRLRLPASWLVRKGMAAGAGLTYLDRTGERRRAPVRAGRHGFGFRVPGSWGASSIALDVPAGVMRRAHPAAPRRRQPFRVRVGFAVRYGDEGEQTLVLRPAG